MQQNPKIANHFFHQWRSGKWSALKAVHHSIAEVRSLAIEKAFKDFVSEVEYRYDLICGVGVMYACRHLNR